MHSHLPQDIGICIVVATALAYLARWARQPLLLAYIAAGVLIGPIGLGIISNADSIQALAEIGLVFLLFIVALEIDVGKLVKSGKAASVATLVQVVGSVLLAWVVALLLGFRGLPGVYLGIMAAFSSTMIVVKHLADRSELDTLPGRVILAILLAQDVLAVAVLAVQPSLGGFSAGESSPIVTLGSALLKGAALVGGTILVGRLVLPRLLHSVGTSPEVLLISGISWCFLVSWVAMQAGFSTAVGALLAGVSIANLPYTLDLVSKVRPLRDFFVTLFFVSLGMLLSVPTARVLIAALVLSVVVIVGRFVTIPPVLRMLGYDNRVGVIGAIHLSQISEFALVIVLAGASPAYRHIDSEIVSIVVLVLVITATLSTYLAQMSHTLARRLMRWTGGTMLEDAPAKAARHGATEDAPIVLVGCFRIGTSLVHALLNAPRRFKVIDFNPEVHRELLRLKVPAVYGDISHLDTLEHAGVQRAEILICSIPDDFLRGTTNRELLAKLRKLNPTARIIVTAQSAPAALQLYAEGADYVAVPRFLTSDRLLDVLGRIESGDLDALRAQELEALKGRPGGPLGA
ncbi:MAG TPA: cation:proton antiporter [Candidatus Polarisedimenticolia bacterium]|nr:cation:proton antiporter [Candidatus Polarisedimenticolia bacterium]